MNGANKKFGLVEQLASQNDGLVFANEAVQCGISRETLRQAVLSGLLENIGHGIYITQGSLADDAYILQKTYPKAIFSHETAAYYLGFTTRDPLKHCVTVPSGYNSKLLTNSLVKVYYSKEIQKEDVVEAKTMLGRTIYCFNIEKTICDLCSSNFDGDRDVSLEVIKGYARLGNKDISKLMNYAKSTTTKKTIRSYLEVLL